MRALIKPLLLAAMLLPAATAFAEHVRAFCLLSADSTAFYEDDCLRARLAFNSQSRQIDLLVYNKTDSTLYLHRDSGLAAVNDDSYRLIGKEEPAFVPLKPRATKRLHTWQMLQRGLSEKVIDQGRYGRPFRWKPGRKGCFISARNGHRHRFQQGDTAHYTPQTTPLLLAGRASYARKASTDSLRAFEVACHVSDIVIGTAKDEKQLDELLPEELRYRNYFSFDSGGCNPLAYVGGVTTLSAGYALAGVGILAYLAFDAWLDQQ